MYQRLFQYIDFTQLFQWFYVKMCSLQVFVFARCCFLPVCFSSHAQSMSLHQNLYTQAGAKANISAGGATPLHIAADNGSLELLNCLLKAGADPNVSDEVRRILKFKHYLLILLLWESVTNKRVLKVYLSQNPVVLGTQKQYD